MRMINAVRKMSVMEFLELLLSLIKSGFSIPISLEVLREKEETKKYSSIITDALEKGAAFSDALCKLSKKLSLYESIFNASCQTGDIVPALSFAVEEMKETEKNRRNIIASAVYPLSVCVLALVLSIILLKYGISYVSLIAQIREELIIKTIISAVLWLICSTGGIILITTNLWRRYDFECTLFKSLYYLNKNAVGMEEAFCILLRERSFTKKDLRCISQILYGLRSGEGLYRMCEKSRRFDVFTSAWLFTAGESGEVNDGLMKIYENYREKQKTLRKASQRFMEPSLLAVTGIYVLILISGCVIPVFMSLGSKIM